MTLKLPALLAVLVALATAAASMPSCSTVARWTARTGFTIALP